MGDHEEGDPERRALFDREVMPLLTAAMKKAVEHGMAVICGVQVAPGVRCIARVGRLRDACHDMQAAWAVLQGNAHVIESDKETVQALQRGEVPGPEPSRN